jgi:ATP-binding cassette subfamily C (CFTR/MRP) protein 3
LNDSQKAYYPSVASNRWLATRLEFIGSMVVFSAALFSVITRESANAGIVGLSLTYALTITQTLNWMVRQSCDIEANIVSVEKELPVESTSRITLEINHHSSRIPSLI